MKQKRTISKHDIIRRQNEMEGTIQFIARRVQMIETVFNDYIEMLKNDDKFQKYLDKKYKEDASKESNG